ncbi:MAG TPA: GNAT family N-acetyltransferase [Candidatus Aphodousia faecavium]|nr:GNAT family N-acetyltransferase [Candidatus Aphodousia faecavium]
MEIREIKKNKKQFISLLLLADEQEDMIDRYLDRGAMFVLDDGGVRSECVVTDEGEGVLEIKNIATYPADQGKGYASSLIQYVAEKYRDQFSVLRVGTGDSPVTVPFYEKLGFVRVGCIKNFFKDNYNHPIIENGVQLIDMIILELKL